MEVNVVATAVAENTWVQCEQTRPTSSIQTVFKRGIGAFLGARRVEKKDGRPGHPAGFEMPSLLG
jgi:hypothetical protein